MSFAAFQEDPSLFEEYHRGYTAQVAKWPMNPLDVIVDRLRSLRSIRSIGDFGCGEAALAEALSDRTVHSFDLVAANERVIACNMSKVPLASESIDCAVFSLSLMSTDWPLMILEAHRTLRFGGLLIIAEVASRLRHGASAFVRGVETIGFAHRPDVLENNDKSPSPGKSTPFFHLSAFEKIEATNGEKKKMTAVAVKTHSSSPFFPQSSRSKSPSAQQVLTTCPPSLLKACLYKKR